MVEYKTKLNEAKAQEKTKPQVSNYIGQSILLICNNLAKKPNFSGYTYKQDMISDGVIDCIAAVDNFDPDRTNNPFAYFTQIAWNAFIRRIQKEKKQSYIKHKNFVNTNLMEEIAREMSITGQPIHNEYSDDVIRNFEDKIVKNSKKAKSGIEKFIEEEKYEEFTPSPSDCN
jgi:DNA-directed RNA polymerase specialized sigma subunit